MSHQSLARIVAGLVVACAVVSTRPVVAAITVDLTASRDATILEEDDAKANGAGSYFFAGNTNSANARRALIAFDLGSIPPGSTITGVSLRLYMSRTQAGSVGVTLHRALDDWTEGPSNAGGQEGDGDAAELGDVTWRYRSYDPSNPAGSPQWSTLGGDFVSGASATTSVGGNGSYTWSSAQMVADVQGWLNAPSTNHGWFVRGPENQTPTAKRFNSRTNNTAAQRPLLTVIYEPPGQSGACCRLGGDICTQETADDCVNIVGGTFQGLGVPCTPGLCADPTGACCAPFGTCSLEGQLDCEGAGGTWQGEDTSCAATDCPVVLEPFLDALPIPRAADPVSGVSGGAATYHVVMQEVQQALHRDLPGVTVWGYGDDPATTSATFPGPTIEAAAGQPVRIRYLNDLRDTAQGGALRTAHYLNVDHCPHGAHEQSARTVVHLHGGHVPPQYDGYPESTFLPGEEAAVCANEPLQTCKVDADCPAPGACDADGAACGADSQCVGHGGAEDCLLCEPGYVYPNDQLPSNIWFHDHALGITRLNVYMGMASLYIIRDAFEQGLGLPGPAPRAGDPPGTTHYEIPLVIQDRSFRWDPAALQFRLDYPAMWHEHFFGDTALVNGKVWPYLDVDRGKYRFRLLNGSNSRAYMLSLDVPGVGGSQDLPFHVIGTDGGLLPAPVTVTELTMGPAERYDVIVDFACADPPACTAPLAPGTQVVLANAEETPGAPPLPSIMQFVVQSTTGFTDPIPATLRPMEVLDPSTAVRTRQFLLRKSAEPCSGQAWYIKSRSEDGVDVGQLWNDVTEFPQLGTTEIWEFANPTVVPHPMHMHLLFFQIVERQAFTLIDDQIVPVGEPIPPAPEERGFKDTARTEPGELLRIVARFDGFEGKYPYHCHILEHEDHEMMRQFQTVKAMSLTLDSGAVSWEAVPGSTGYDLVEGDLGALRSSGGDFSTATTACLVNGLLTLNTPHLGTPAPGQGSWYLGRTRDAVGRGTFDSGEPSQVGARDAEIAASGAGCP